MQSLAAQDVVYDFGRSIGGFQQSAGVRCVDCLQQPAVETAAQLKRLDNRLRFLRLGCRRRAARQVAVVHATFRFCV